MPNRAASPPWGWVTQSLRPAPSTCPLCTTGLANPDSVTYKGAIPLDIAGPLPPPS